MLAGGTCGTLALQQQCLLASWGTEGQLIEGQDLTASLQDAFTCLFGDVQSADRHLGHLEQTQVIGDGTNNNDSRLGLFGSVEETRHTLQRHWWAIGFAHKQTLQHNAIEFLVGTTLQETVQLEAMKKKSILDTSRIKKSYFEQHS